MHFVERQKKLQEAYETLLSRKNEKVAGLSNGIFDRYQFPVLTAAHAPLCWRYDFDPVSNPFLMERIGVNAVFNAGALYWKGKYLLVARVEGTDRKSFFAIAESERGIDGFRFREFPILLPETADPDINVYDMRLTRVVRSFAVGEHLFFKLFCI